MLHSRIRKLSCRWVSEWVCPMKVWLTVTPSLNFTSRCPWDSHEPTPGQVFFTSQPIHTTCWYQPKNSPGWSRWIVLKICIEPQGWKTGPGTPGRFNNHKTAPNWSFFSSRRDAARLGDHVSTMQAARPVCRCYVPSPGGEMFGKVLPKMSWWYSRWIYLEKILQIFFGNI